MKPFSLCKPLCRLELPIPFVVKVLAESVLREGGASTEGIFR